MAQRPLTDSIALAPPATRRATLAVYLELGKARLSALVLLTTAVGYAVSAGEAFDAWIFVCTLGGTACAALGANALNQWLEAERDARMERTRGRPLPTGRIAPVAALRFAIVAGVIGPALIAWQVNVTAAGLALSAYVIYVALYTPLKSRSTANTLVGAVVGALPPLVGSAATGYIDAGGWILASLLFVWQIPHFLALAWLYRDDYRRGGLRMLPLNDPGGHFTGCVAVLYTLGLLPLTVMLTITGVTGWWYAAGAGLLGLAFLGFAVGLERRRDAAAARRLFLASIVYLPLLLGLVVFDRRPPRDTRAVHADSPPPAQVRHDVA